MTFKNSPGWAGSGLPSGESKAMDFQSELRDNAYLMNWSEMTSSEIVFWVYVLAFTVIGLLRLAYKEGR